MRNRDKLGLGIPDTARDQARRNYNAQIQHRDW